MNTSIKNRIALISVISVAILSLVVFIAIYQSLKVSAFGEIDEKLEFEATKHIHELIFKKDTVYFAYAEELLEREHLEIEVYPIYIELVDTKKQLLVKSENLKNKSIILETNSTSREIFNTYVSEEPLRQIQLPLEKNGKIYGEIAIAVSLEDTLSVLKNLKNNLLAIYPILLLITFFASRYISKITIQPLTKIADTVSVISSENLNLRVHEIKGDDELSVLTKSINGFLDRIHASIEKEKQFTANASHQLRTPLTAIKGNLEVLLRRKRSAEEYEQQIQETVDRIDRLNLALDNLLILARMDEDAKSLKKEDVNLVEIINSKIKLFKATIEQKELQIVVQQELYTQMVTTNLYFLRIILENLLSNAIKYSLPKKPLQIHLKENKETISISISNTGGNLLKEDVKHVFDTFYRSTNNTEKGYGIGLALVQKAAKVLAYEILVELDEATTFTVQIPKKKLP